MAVGIGVTSVVFALSLVFVDGLSAQTMRGFADIHNHQFANMAFGGYVVAGSPYGPIEMALSEASCRAGHSFRHNFDILGGYLAGYGGPIDYGNDGYRAFGGWPRFFEVSHQKVHQDFLRRAVDGGLRLMVMMAVESPILCKGVKNGGGKTDGRNCDAETPSISNQIQAAYTMQDYIDGQSGGAGQGWYRIVTTPAEARRVIQAGKLAVVLGVETSHLFECKSEGCDWPGGLNALWNQGVRHFFPIHHDQNAFGGPSYFQKSIQNGVRLLDVEPYRFPTYSCGYTFGSCGTLALTGTGKTFVEALMDRGAIIDVDHMSDRSFSDTLDIAERRRYPVVASHAGFNAINKGDQDHEGQYSAGELQRIRNVGGMFGLISSQGDISTVRTYTRPGHTVSHICGRSTETFAQAYYYALDKAPGMSIAIGTDINGPLRQVGPRFGSYQCNGGVGAGAKWNVRLPDTFLARGSNTWLPRQVAGDRIFDYNNDGLAHIGLLPDMLADLEVLEVPPGDLEPLFNSAEGYVRMWERAWTSANPTLSLTDLTLNSGTVDYRVENSITVTAVTIGGSASVSLSAGSVIRLLPEFRATAGTAGVTFRARN